MKNSKKLNCHFWCLNECLLKINTKCNFNWNDFMNKLSKIKRPYFPPQSGGKKKLEHKDQISSKEVLKNLRLMIDRKEQK